MQSSINLLPPDKKRALQQGLVMVYAQSMTILLFLTSIFVSATLFSVRVMLKNDFESLDKQAQAAGSDEAQKIIASIKQVNSYLKETEALQKGFVPWGKLLEKVTALVPDHVRLDKAHIDEGGKIVLTGVAETRDDAMLLEKSLKESSLVTDVKNSTPFILQKKDVPFEFEMKYAPRKDF